MVLGTDETKVGKIAVEVATKGESENSAKIKFRCDLSEFGRFVGIWLFTAAVLFGALTIITVVRGERNIVRSTIGEVDTLSMMFSLVLSALLEQIWSRGVNKGKLYGFTLGVEGVFVILGGMLFTAYSIVKITNPENQLLRFSFELNVGYIVASTIVVVLGFLSRAIHEK